MAIARAAGRPQISGTVGLNRDLSRQGILDTGGSRELDAAFAALKAGRGFVSNGPLLGLLVDGRKPGDSVEIPAPGKHKFSVALRSFVPVDHLELVQNGKVLRSFTLSGDRRTFDVEGELELDKGGWLLLRAWNDGADPQVLDLYPYASTNPIYLKSPAGPPSAQSDASYFAEWIDRAIWAMKARTDFNDEGEKRETLDYLKRASEAYLALAESQGTISP